MKTATAIYSTKADQLPAKTIQQFSGALLNRKPMREAMAQAGITSYCLASELLLRLVRRGALANGHLEVGDLVLVTGHERALVLISLTPLVVASPKGTLRLTESTISLKDLTFIGNAPTADIATAKRRLFV